MLPGVSPCAVGEHVADGITCYRSSIVAGQQIFPAAIVGIAYGIQHRTQCAGGVGIFLFLFDIACVIVGISPRSQQRLVILPNQLVGRIVGILSSIRAITDGKDIAVLPFR